MKLITVVGAHNVLDSFANKEDIGAHLAYWMTKFVASTQPDFEFFQKSAKKIFDKYGEVDSEGNAKVKQENAENFKAEMDELENTEVETPTIKFNLSELSNEIKISMKQMYPLLDFIDEEK